MGFSGFDEDGDPLFDSKESAIERAQSLRKWGLDPDTKIYVQRDLAPNWLASLVRDTPFQWIAYEEI